MKKIITIIAILAIAAPFAGAADTVERQVTVPNGENNAMNLRIDRETTALLKRLEQDKKDLQAEFEKADANRSMTIEGASPLAQERFQMVQDSICMDIRSKLVDVQLQIDEIRK